MNIQLLSIHAFVIVSLVGCATPGELISEASPIDLQSSQPPIMVANCIVQNGEEIYSGVSGIVRKPGGEAGRTDVLLRSGQNPLAVVHVWEVGQGSRIRLFFGRLPSLIPGTYTERLTKGCL